MKTEVKLTSESLDYWQKWYSQTLVDRLKPFDALQEPGCFWVYCTKSKRLEFSDLRLYTFKHKVIPKVSKLKVGFQYRKDIQGWIVPDDLVEAFFECLAVSRLYASLRNDAIDAISKAPWSGYQRVKNLPPEKMQLLIDLFAE